MTEKRVEDKGQARSPVAFFVDGLVLYFNGLHIATGNWHTHR
jgi:hypothetical protein